MEFYCADNNCPGKGGEPYTITLPPEVCVDEHNYATMFCPHCQNALVKKN